VPWQIKFTKQFIKQFKHLKPTQQQRFYDRLTLFEHNHHASILRNHALKGKYLGFRSIDISGDLRALYTVKADTIIIFGFIGSHAQLYR
jgi:addiction module RelE/StbE family toxin